ncbi:DUF4297 domain-containing protein [Vibrio cholerae]|nr:DUF4297 domain-containing protein [Vibrio cholerae]ELJ8517131.1 DUF4297 domain-containing protein [Vibrio cholerae]
MNVAANSGVVAISGFEFQLNCALYLLLNNYEKFKDKEFFLCIEHHDDFLYCFQSDDLSYITDVEAYQAKKLSGNIWKINSRLFEIVTKILSVGENIVQDAIKKSSGFTHSITFISNTEMELEYKPSKSEEKNGKKQVTIRINEQLVNHSYTSLPLDIKNKIERGIENYCSEKSSIFHKQHMDKLSFYWVDFPRVSKGQIEILIGIMKNKFPHVVDPKAAVDLLLKLFSSVENVYNQGNIVTLLDSSKRVQGREIKKAIEVIEDYQKTYEIWRNNSEKFSDYFNIPIGVQENAKDIIASTYELLKDLSNHEHQIIKAYIRENNYAMNYSSYLKMFNAYNDEIKRNYQIQMNDYYLFFAVVCSYVEIYG